MEGPWKNARRFTVCLTSCALILALGAMGGCRPTAQAPQSSQEDTSSQPTEEPTATVEPDTSPTVPGDSENTLPQFPPIDASSEPPIPPAAETPTPAFPEAVTPEPTPAEGVPPAEPPRGPDTSAPETPQAPEIPPNPLRSDGDRPLRPDSPSATDSPTTVPEMNPTTPGTPYEPPGVAEIDDRPSSEGPENAPPQILQTPAESAKPLTHSRIERPPFDPIKENGQFFVGWSKPKAALIITGREEGYFEPCGCAGKERMKGGLSRRHSMIRQLQEQGWPTTIVDVGGLIKGFGKQTEIKFSNTVEAYRKIGYHAMNLGAPELRLPSTLLLSVMTSGEGESPFVSANVALFDFAADEWTARYKLVQAGDMTFGITGILGKEYHTQLNNPDLQFRDPAEALRDVLPKLETSADVLVLLTYSSEEEALELAKAFPQFKVIVNTDGPAEPPGAPRTIPGTDRFFIQVGEKGMAAVVLGFFDDPNTPIAYQRVILDSRYPDSPEMKAVMRNYQAQLVALGFDGLEIRPVPHPRKEEQGTFVGTKKCASCHEASYEVWKKSGHSKAWETLVELEIPRTGDPQCVSCHVTGWHPTRYFPYESGFVSEAQTPELTDVGCESCHGPGSKHVEAEMGTDLELQKKAAEAMVVTKQQMAESEVHSCRNCHDLDNSPEFDFETYWPLVEHYE